jgi:hypothetical protein
VRADQRQVLRDLEVSFCAGDGDILVLRRFASRRGEKLLGKAQVVLGERPGADRLVERRLFCNDGGSGPVS